MKVDTTVEMKVWTMDEMLADKLVEMKAFQWAEMLAETLDALAVVELAVKLADELAEMLDAKQVGGKGVTWDEKLVG